MSGRSDTNKIVIFDQKNFKKGDYVEVEITDSTSATLKAKPLRKISLVEFYGASVEA
jgi:tRNA-2-methylthio-N6-dimethylallyladenosine synthase